MHSHTDSDQPPYRSGDVVLAAVYNPFENRNSHGKIRPVVLVEEVDGHWRVAGLTTNAHRRDGNPRVAIPNPLQVGLRGPGYLWGNRLHNISKLDVSRRIGHAGAALARRIADSHPMSGRVRAEFLRACGVTVPRPPAGAPMAGEEWALPASADNPLALARRLGTAVRKCLSDSALPLRGQHLRLVVETDDAELIEITMAGVPPFVDLVVDVDGEAAGRFTGHPGLTDPAHVEELDPLPWPVHVPDSLAPEHQRPEF